MLYTIKGTNSNLKPYLVTAHFDVVGVTEAEWSYPPFEARIKDGFIYSRGTMDDKASMLAQLEAIKVFLKKNGQPRRTIYLAYGSDEEQMGLKGAANIAAKLKNIELEYVLDEGLMVIDDFFKDVARPIALIGVAEKGYLSVKYKITTTGGHSSMPDNKESAIGIMSEAITK